MRIKICGITDVDQARAVAKAGADAIGLVFYEKSPRRVSRLTAQTIVDALPPFVSSVGLFVNHTTEQVWQILEQVSLDYLQFHGDESPAFCQQFKRPYIKAIRVKEDVDLVQYTVDFNTAKALLVDAYQEGVPGGTGRTFDWRLIPRELSKLIILSGGLTPENVGQAIKAVKPWAVDVSSGVEQSPGIKDINKCQAFIQGARNEAV
ncbi:MAG: N-(5'-phosphoribosyl)anthranilate isomerase [Ferrovum sp. 37-45-19]|jgi:phosphoribosylanthranilate isomerase|uniref:phosphoribosylanthranilate isomerase n=1 Tax=Ferrovum sp. JA12 TaxID=1356299 RepID=UPI0007037F77|nr:phosphoribosylanthranilate isomerase [Ferrovum sp. JA12]OYV80245.1 MAG: N-(5'-phosphoribosyl)anthranilate isomerase [Ferrovum sp. 21-44-67]OYV94522.1 MAG: N-(5'-phosphoribosyl)anthranilate isomerase [Ferrovum sp. 37-45-19]HQT81578.1 phosphoribosylanthranilate isomerase [Ferrovaceae bacterium]KRH78927.1 N-(5'-phosphoribosyl)anthranilate isomerase [Ferrovum sp. JA12]HQU06467.1 phosphoribosylanthranilate isomerase [Ferrovaceae bacterium]